jgi:malate synthase
LNILDFLPVATDWLETAIFSYHFYQQEQTMTQLQIPQGMEITGQIKQDYEKVLTFDALNLVAKLSRVFESRRQALLASRVERAKRLDAGERPDFLAETSHIRAASWTIAPIPAALQCRRVEITGPVERKMVINALNSGADSYMTDFEDSNTPNWDNQITGQLNMIDAVRKTIALEQNGKSYKLNDKVATLVVRPRGWHLDEKHVLVDGKRISGGIFDFALFLFHNAKEQLARGAGPYFYLPKMESHLEARLWNDIFVMAQTELGLPQGTIKATVLIETILAAFEMDEILYELRDHSAGLNAGRWDYIFSCIKKFKHDKNFCLADRAKVTMTAPFMRSYALLLLKTCHRRNAPAIGGMSALIPIKNDPEKNDIAMGGVKNDKARDAGDGYDGGWVAHPGLVDLAMTEFKKVLGDKPNQIDKQRLDVSTTGADLLNFQPETPITEAGLRYNINVGIHYLGSWLAGNGCVPIHNLMEDAATAEISRSQVWQWIRSDKGVLDDGRKVTRDMVRAMIPEELAKVQADVGSGATYPRAAQIFDEMTTSESFAEFLTLPLYEEV